MVFLPANLFVKVFKELNECGIVRIFNPLRYCFITLHIEYVEKYNELNAYRGRYRVV